MKNYGMVVLSIKKPNGVAQRFGTLVTQNFKSN